MLMLVEAANRPGLNVTHVKEGDRDIENEIGCKKIGRKNFGSKIRKKELSGKFPKRIFKKIGAKFSVNFLKVLWIKFFCQFFSDFFLQFFLKLSHLQCFFRLLYRQMCPLASSMAHFFRPPTHSSTQQPSDRWWWWSRWIFNGWMNGCDEWASSRKMMIGHGNLRRPVINHLNNPWLGSRAKLRDLYFGIQRRGRDLNLESD